MNRKIILSTIFIYCSLTSIAQQIPVGSCGIVCIYDATGCRTRRVYFCNNGLDPYPTKNSNTNLFADSKSQVEFQPAEALYPNPTSGICNIEFSKALDKASIVVVDNNGKVVQKFIANGKKITFNLAGLSAGVYFINIKEKNSTITKKVIKE